VKVLAVKAFIVCGGVVCATVNAATARARDRLGVDGAHIVSIMHSVNMN
jgi:hypothetical protein